MKKLYVYLLEHLVRKTKKVFMKMIKKYWWLIALAALAYWKCDEVKAMFTKTEKTGSSVSGYTGFAGSTLNDATNEGIANDLEGFDSNGNGVPDILEGSL
jgi:hypothetical protein